MTYSGPLFYDDPKIFSTYMSRRSSETSANETLEKPVLISLLGDLKNTSVLDLGCGEATLAPYLFEQGCASYHGIDGSENMVKLAKKHLDAYENVLIERDYIEMFPYPEAEYDWVISRLAFHYIEDINSIFKCIAQSLKPGGRFVFSAEHPVITSNHTGGGGAAPRQDWTVDRYFQTGQRKLSWLGGEVFKYHRTIEDYFQALLNAGFKVDQLKESKPDPKLFKDKKLLERRSRVPLFIFFAAQKDA